MPGAYESVYLRSPSRHAAANDSAIEKAFSDVKEAAVDLVRNARWMRPPTKSLLIAKA